MISQNGPTSNLQEKALEKENQVALKVYRRLKEWD